MWLEVDIHGVAAHGGFPDLGIGAILKASFFLVEVDRYGQQLEKSGGHHPAGPPSIHVATIKGGEEWSTYPACYTIQLERCIVTGETADSVKQDIQGLLEGVTLKLPDFKFDLGVTFARTAIRRRRR